MSCFDFSWAHRSIDWLIDWLFARSFDRFIVRSIDWLIDYLLAHSIDCSIDWLIPLGTASSSCHGSLRRFHVLDGSANQSRQPGGQIQGQQQLRHDVQDRPATGYCHLPSRHTTRGEEPVWRLRMQPSLSLVRQRDFRLHLWVCFFIEISTQSFAMAFSNSSVCVGLFFSSSVFKWRVVFSARRVSFGLQTRRGQETLRGDYGSAVLDGDAGQGAAGNTAGRGGQRMAGAALRGGHGQWLWLCRGSGEPTLLLHAKRRQEWQWWVNMFHFRVMGPICCIDWLIDLFDWFVCLIDRLRDWLIDWLSCLSEWVSEWLIDWLIDWFFWYRYPLVHQLWGRQPDPNLANRLDWLSLFYRLRLHRSKSLHRQCGAKSDSHDAEQRPKTNLQGLSHISSIFSMENIYHDGCGLCRSFWEITAMKRECRDPYRWRSVRPRVCCSGRTTEAWTCRPRSGKCDWTGRMRPLSSKMTFTKSPSSRTTPPVRWSTGVTCSKIR